MPSKKMSTSMLKYWIIGTHQEGDSRSDLRRAPALRGNANALKKSRKVSPRLSQAGDQV